jgi:hypothetical protein
MAKSDVELKEKPTVHFTTTGVPYINPRELLSTKAGQSMIFSIQRMPIKSGKTQHSSKSSSHKK